MGVVKIDRSVDFKDEMAQKERLSQVGLSADEDLFAPILMSARNRWFWLGLNLTTATDLTDAAKKVVAAAK